MIVDLLINTIVGILDAAVSVLPDMPETWLDSNVLKGFFAFDYYFPMSEFLQLLPVMLSVYAAFGIWRTVRYFLPGG